MFVRVLTAMYLPIPRSQEKMLRRVRVFVCVSAVSLQGLRARAGVMVGGRVRDRRVRVCESGHK